MMRMKTYVNGCVLLFVSMFLLASCGGGGGGEYGSSSSTGTTSSTVQLVTCPTTTKVDVTISGSSFSPADVTVPVNGVVKWTNTDGILHTVSSPRAAPYSVFNQNVPANGGSICLKFTGAGTFQYLCTIHTFMTGTVTVN